ncbi:hypothetical protein F5Y13DRAFT_184428 [Hypoxylon sp. FL1857]|nr:hypothetical protein F5Y13DRAFT_184428 [Hypoxylon sp. FL1857]
MEPELPDFEVRTQEEAKQVESKIDAIENYIDGIEHDVILPTATEDVLNKITSWIPYAKAELNGARDRFARGSETWDLIDEMKDALRSIEFDIGKMFERNDELKERSGQVNGC